MLPEQSHRKSIGGTTDEPMRYDLIIDSMRDLDFTEQASEQTQPVQFAQSHQRAGIAQHGGHDV